MRKNCMFGVGMERRNDLCEVNIKSLEFDDKLIIFDEESFYYTVRSDIYIVYVGYLKGKASKRRKTILLVEFHPVILYEKNIFIYRNKDGSLAVSDMIKNDPDYIEMLQKFKDLFQQKYANVLAVKNIIEANGTFYFVLDYNKVMRSNLIPVDEVINADSMDSINIDDINSEEDFKKIYKEFDIRKRLYREDFMYVGLKIDFDTRERMRICLEKILELQIKINGKNSLDAAIAYHELGEYFLLFEKDYDKAIENFEKVLEIRENQLPKGHEDTFFIMYELGLLYQHMGDKSKESEYANRALDIREELTGQNYRDGIRMDSFLMKCHFDNIRNKKETEYREAVIALHESMFDEESELLARMYYDASICSYSIDKEKSKEYAMKSLEIYEKINSEDHHMVTSIYFMINTYFGMDNIDFPNEFFQKESDVTEDWSEEDDEFIYALRKFMDLD